MALAGMSTVLASLADVDPVVVFGEDTPLGLIETLRPDVLVKGADYKTSEIAGREFAGKIARVKLVKGKSTTAVINKLSVARL